MAVAHISEMQIKTCKDEASCLTVLSDLEHCEDTTDAGDSHSETEASVAVSASECESEAHCSRMVRRCRFGNTPLETIPATPVGATMRSPPGLSRAAMRRARDQCQAKAFAMAEDSTASKPRDRKPSPVSDRSSKPCRFSSSQLGTVPKTPVGAGSWKVALAKAIGSPPGLSRTAMRRERDACNAEALSSASWGSSTESAASAKALTFGPLGHPMTPPALRSAKRKAMREALLMRTKKEAALLQVQAEQVCAAMHMVPDESDDSKQVTEAEQSSSSEGEGAADRSGSEGQPCRFTGASLRTVPLAAAADSPPGLSRAALRRARDAVKSEALPKPSWGCYPVQVTPPVAPALTLAVQPDCKATTQVAAR